VFVYRDLNQHTDSVETISLFSEGGDPRARSDFLRSAARKIDAIGEVVSDILRDSDQLLELASDAENSPEKREERKPHEADSKLFSETLEPTTIRRG
jgi:hypothetical protein